MAENKKAGGFIFRNMRYLTLAGVIAVMVVIFGAMNARFFGFSNLMNIIRQSSVLAVLSIGMTFVILTGGIELSVGSNIAVSGAVGVLVFNATHSAALSLLSALAAGLLIGLLNGVLVGRLKIAAFIATLATQTAFRGLNMLMINAGAVRLESEVYKFISQGDVFGVPFMLFIVAALYMIFLWISSSHVLGRHIYAVGGNSSAARAMGVDVEKRVVQVYMIAGAMAGVSAILTVGRVMSAQPWAGLNTEFDVITAVVLGGTSLLGGTGNLKGTVFGALLMGVISNGMGLINVEPYLEYIVKGLLVLIAVYADIVSSALRHKRLTPSVEKESARQREDIGAADKVRSIAAKSLEMEGITKAFPGMKALDNASLSVAPGDIVALMGENGAGKSTLMKILAGEEKRGAGNIKISGNIVEIDTPHKAADLGIAMIHQEFSLVSELSVAQNIFLGKEIKSRVPGFVSRKRMEAEAREVLGRMGIRLDVSQKVRELSVSEQQMVEIGKALKTNAWLLILDEPTSALTEEEKNHLFTIMRRLKSEGMSMIYISHRMSEIFEIADAITILRDGQYVASGRIAEFDENRIIRQMVGRELNNIFTREKAEIGDVVLKVERLSKKGSFEDVSFEVRRGEVLGFSGLMGAGRTEIAKCVFGLDSFDSGRIWLNGKEVRFKNPLAAINSGVAYVPEDRRLEGFVPFMSIRENLNLPSYPRNERFGRIDKKAESGISRRYVEQLRIKTTSENKNVLELSGGNQQKVSLGKWLATQPQLLILDEPTRGVDVGAKAEIHKLIESIAKQGVAVILISSELPELLGCADNLIVLCEGRVTGYLACAEATQDSIMERASHKEETAI